MTDDRIPIVIEDETLRGGFTAIPNTILKRHDVSPGAKLCYVMLLSYAWQEGSCFPGQVKLAEDIGVTSRSVVTYMKELQESGLVVVKRRGLGQTNIYTLPRSENISLQEVKKTTYQEVKNLHPNKTQVKKDSVEKHTDSSRPRKTDTFPKNGHVYDEARLTLVEYIADLSSEFIDTASVESSTTRAVNLFRRSGVPLDQFIDIMTKARAITKERMASIKKRTQDGDKTKMAYFFSVLEDQLQETTRSGGNTLDSP